MKVSRSRDDLIARLKEHCAILDDFHRKVWVEGQQKYLGEIAGKLRVLVHSARTNRPLLLDLMKEAGITVQIPFDEPRGRYETDLPTYLARFACAIPVPSGGMAEVSNSELIALWAEQRGASHEDWQLDERLDTILKGGFVVSGQLICAHALCSICRTVLYTAEQFLEQLAHSQQPYADEIK